MNDSINDDGSGLEGRKFYVPDPRSLSTDQSRKRVRQQQDSMSSSDEGHDDSYPVADNYNRRNVKLGTIKACNECRQQKVRALHVLADSDWLTSFSASM